MQNLRFSIAAGETKVFVLAGRYLEIIDAVGPVTLGLYDENGSQTDDAKDVLSGTYMEGAFSQFELYSATAQTVELFLTNTRGGTRRQPGNVRVIDQSADKTAAGAQFIGSASKPAAAAAWGLAGIQANTKRVAVKRIVMASDVAGTMGLWLATGAPTVNPSVSAWQNKLTSGAASDAKKVLGESAGVPTNVELPGNVNFLNAQVSASAPYEVPMTTPIVLMPGQALVVGGWVVNRQVQTIIDFEEL